MCGIAGHIGRSRPTDSQIAAATRLLEHRGPDDVGLWSQDLGDGSSCTFVFTRLAIQDLTPAASQPFHSGPVTMAFNGEVYNFIELRAMMEAKGERFLTGGDTEVLARLLARRGPEALKDVDGMFALAWWSQDDRVLTLARDAFGEKPLLIHQGQHDLWFASEVNALSGISGKHFRPNFRHIRRFLVNGYRSLHKTKETFHLGVESLDPAQVLTIDRDALVRASTHFWQPRDEPMTLVPSYLEAVALTREQLAGSLQRRLRADVPVALTLSGGVDSTALLAIAVGVLHHSVDTFTIVSGDQRYDDSSIAAATARFFGVSNDAVDIRDFHFMEELPNQVAARGTPVLTVSSYAQCALMRRIASSGSKVVIEGIGADEVFAGYYDHQNAFLSDLRLRQPAAYDEALDSWRKGPGRFVRNPHLKDPSVLVNDPSLRDHLYLDSAQFASLLVDTRVEEFTELRLSPWLLRNRMLNEIRQETVPVLLAEADANAMSSSIENRSPYLERGIVDWVYGLPQHYLVRGGVGKALLRDAVLPLSPSDVILDPEKRGFNLSIEQLINLRDLDIRRSILRESPIWQVVNRSRMAALLGSGEPLPNSKSKFLFAFLSVRAFLESFDL